MESKVNKCDFGKLVFYIVDLVESKQIWLWKGFFWILQYDVAKNKQIWLWKFVLWML